MKGRGSAVFSSPHFLREDFFFFPLAKNREQGRVCAMVVGEVGFRRKVRVCVRVKVKWCYLGSFVGLRTRPMN